MAAWLTTLPTFILLLLILVISTGEMVHGQLLKLGETMFSDKVHHVQYFLLRGDPQKPDCNPNLDIDVEVARRVAAQATKPKGDLDDIFADAKIDPVTERRSLASTLEECKDKFVLYGQWVSHLTPQVKAYRIFEGSFFTLFKFGAENRAMILIALLIVTAGYTSLGYHHICLRPPRFARDFLVQSISMLIANSLMLYSAVRYYQISLASGTPIDEPRIYFMWMALFAVMSLVSLYRLFSPPESEEAAPGTWTKSLECVPLVATMGIITCIYFFGFRGHDSGPVIYVNKMLDMLSIPLALSLHIWAGMLFKQSRLVELFLNILRPWKLSPEMLTYLILLAAGLPTAYAGVSSVFVIAAGAIIYHEIRAAGGTAQYALASTAMSGSLGVVLRPSLLVVGIAALNRQVTTAQLFYWGGWVFLLTSTMFFLASQLHRRNRHQGSAVASPAVAIPGMLKAIKPVIPFVLVIGLIIWFYHHVLETPFNEISAPSILPILMLFVLVYDKKVEAREVASGTMVASTPAVHDAHRVPGAVASIKAATTETVEHVGAYICLMLFTQIVSGMVERSDVMSMAPQHFPNVWLAMGFLVVTKVILGMVMEPLGAIMLVSGTLAPMAYNNGIAPVNFWMMVLVAFELGYLLPPVALNQLLTRQVVGEDEIDRADAEVAGLSLYRRYERWILPCAVMALSLLVVAFGPMVVTHIPELHPITEWFHPPG